MNFRAVDVMSGELPSARLGDPESAWLLGKILSGQGAPLALWSLEVERRCVEMARAWGSEDSVRAAELVEIFRRLEQSCGQIRDLLSDDAKRELAAENVPELHSAAYYLWLLVQHRGELVVPAIVRYGCYKAAWFGIAERVHRAAPLLAMRFDGRDGALSVLRDRGIGGPAAFALSVTGPLSADQEYRKIAGRVRAKLVGVAGKISREQLDNVGSTIGIELDGMGFFPEVLNHDARHLIQNTFANLIDDHRSLRKTAKRGGRNLVGAGLVSEESDDDDDGAHLLKAAVKRDRTDRYLDLRPVEERVLLAEIDEAAKSFSPTNLRTYRLMRRGLSSSDIAQRLGITKAAVSQQRKRILEALEPLIADRRKKTRPRP